jgi:uncharacterized glyoxalase superfamily protein PhnB
VLAIKDLASVTDYFVRVLGFRRDFSVEGWEFLSLDEFQVMLGECIDDVTAYETKNHSYFAHVLVDNVNALFESMKSNGASFSEEIADKRWGVREFFVVTPEGHRIGFAQSIERGQVT